jgi:glutathione S-transferase
VGGAPTLYHIPVCPFSQRLEILLALKGLGDAVAFETVDITRPRSPALLARTHGTTALPILDLGDGRILKESLVILRWLEDVFPEPPVARLDPYERAVEGMLVALEHDFVAAGYAFLMNQDRARRHEFESAMLDQYSKLERYLRHYARDPVWLFHQFGWAETVFTPFFVRFQFLDYYEGFDPPADEFKRVRRWRDACLQHPAAQQVSREEVIKVYYDYSRGVGNGGHVQGREVSSFTLERPWRERPWPPQDKYRPGATDAELGLV